MPSITLDRGAPPAAPSHALAPARIALLGCGTVGSAFARLALSPPRGAHPLHITGALVRDAHRPRARPLPSLTEDSRGLLASAPDVVVELLGGVEPARSLLLAALARGIAVVTANKALLALHGGELRRLALETGAPLLCEAAVLAGVPFLGTFSRRPHAASATGFVAIANGTSNFVLTRCAEGGCDIADAVAEAQVHGYAEADPGTDLSGVDARDKLVVLLQHFAHLEVSPDAIETEGLDAIRAGQLSHARELGGVIKPVIMADWSGDGVAACAGPAFVPAGHPLAGVNGVENALVLHTRGGRLIFQGPGAGPDVTAATVLDDVQEVLAGNPPGPRQTLTARVPASPATGWLMTVEGSRLPDGVDVADLLASHGLFAHRVSQTSTEAGRERRSLLLWPAHRTPVQHAVTGLAAASGCAVGVIRALGAPR